MALEDLVIVTGMSGSGKGTVVKTFEDLGFFCIDNLPVSLIPVLVDGIRTADDEIKRAVLVIDIRAGERLGELEKMLQQLRSSVFNLFVLFLEADENALVRRFSETRRPHPLQGQKRSLRDSIRAERKRLTGLREMADVSINTSLHTVHSIKALVTEIFRKQVSKPVLNVHLLSFGYKNGVPQEADLMFDARFLPNPYFVPGLRGKTGKDKQVAAFLQSTPETARFVRRVADLLKYLLPKYEREGKRYLTVAVGCTGGHHRSVHVVEELADILKSKKRSINVQHRDIKH